MVQNGLAFAYKDGKIVDISEVEKGLACDCICPVCGAKLIANKGNKNRHHFKHYRVEECKNYGETLLHLAGKQIIMENREIILPTFNIQNGNYSLYKKNRYIKAQEELKVQNIIPDTIIYFKNNKKIFVEIKVTHEVDEEKFKKLKEIGISTLEIDLSFLLNRNDSSLNLNELKELVLYKKYNKEWVYDKNYDNNMKAYQNQIEYEKFLKAMEIIDKEQRKKRNFKMAQKERLNIYNKSIKGFLKKTRLNNLSGFFFLDDYDEEIMICFKQMKSSKCHNLRYILTKYKYNNHKQEGSRLGALFENNGKLNGNINIAESKVKIEILKTNKLKNWEFEIKIKQPSPKKFI